MIRLSLEGLEVLDAIDRRGSFSAAGRQLHKVASTISYTVAQLEAALGVPLFERAGPRATLTAAGRELLAEGRHLLRAAADLENRVRRVAVGWETGIRVGLDSLFAPAALAADVEAFYQVADGTRLWLLHEALTGCWEALLERRADLLIGAAGEGPSGGGYIAEPLGTLRFVFCVAPGHPLARVRHRLTSGDLAAHRAVAVADSARRLPARTVGLLFGQDTLTVPDLRTKYHYQLQGLGFGFLPEPCARSAIASGSLVMREVAEPKPDERFYLAWRSGEEGRALAWWRQRAREPGRLAQLLAASL
jgi:DNA-binding transcriptional LysR family regulator